MTQWTEPADFREQIERVWNRGDVLRTVLTRFEQAHNDTQGGRAIDLPYRVRLRGPSTREMSEHFDRVRDWVDAMRRTATRYGCEIEWKTINHRQLGRNDIPTALLVPDVACIARIAGTRTEVDRFAYVAETLMTRLPETAAWIRRRPFDLLSLEESLDRLIRFVEWMRVHPPDGRYLRQVDLPGIDTKFLESHTAVLSAWLETVLPDERIDDDAHPTRSFAQRYGFSRKPELARFRLLDPELAPGFGGFTDVSVTTSEFARCRIPERGVKRIVVVENDISALALPDLPAAVALFGRGYNFDFLSDTTWLSEVEVDYWGDIDTHGFAILNQFRAFAPHARSVLMDRDTLLAHREHWTQEPSPYKGNLERLTPEERALYSDLIADRHGHKVRLEQERIRYGLVRKAVQ